MCSFMKSCCLYCVLSGNIILYSVGFPNTVKEKSFWRYDIYNFIIKLVCCWVLLPLGERRKPTYFKNRIDAAEELSESGKITYI